MESIGTAATQAEWIRVEEVVDGWMDAAVEQKEEEKQKNKESCLWCLLQLISKCAIPLVTAKGD